MKSRWIEQKRNKEERFKPSQIEVYIKCKLPKHFS